MAQYNARSVVIRGPYKIASPYKDLSVKTVSVYCLKKIWQDFYANWQRRHWMWKETVLKKNKYQEEISKAENLSEFGQTLPTGSKVSHEDLSGEQLSVTLNEMTVSKAVFEWTGVEESSENTGQSIVDAPGNVHIKLVPRSGGGRLYFV